MFLLGVVVVWLLVDSIKHLVKGWYVDDADQTRRTVERQVAEALGHVFRGKLRSGGHCRVERGAGCRCWRVQVDEARRSVWPWEERHLCDGAHHASKVLLHAPQEDGTGRDAVKVPAALVVKVQLANGLDHGQKLGVLLLGSYKGVVPELGTLDSAVLSVAEFLLDGRIQCRVSQVNVWNKLAQESLRALQAALQCLNVLGRRVPPPIGRLVICTFCGH